jgi:hypothetical protein
LFILCSFVSGKKSLAASGTEPQGFEYFSLCEEFFVLVIDLIAFDTAMISENA